MANNKLPTSSNDDLLANIFILFLINFGVLYLFFFANIELIYNIDFLRLLVNNNMKLVGPALGENNFEDISALKSLEKVFLEKRGYIFRMPKKNESVILLVSGGLDCISLWQILMEKYQLHVYPLHLRRGRFNSRLLAIKFFSEYFKEKYPKLFHRPEIVNWQSNFSFTKGKNINLSDTQFILSNLIYNKKLQEYRIPVIDNPARINYFMLTAYEYALKLKFKRGINVFTILLSYLNEDSEACRETTLSVLRAANLLFCLILGDWRLQISAPMEKKNAFYFNKKDFIKLSKENGLPIERTYSCEKSFLIHCGFCHGCQTRRRRFAEAKVRDKTWYLAPRRAVKLYEKLIKYKKFFQPRSAKKTARPVKILPTTKIVASVATELYEKNKKTYLFNKKSGDIRLLNQQAAYIWKLFTKGRTVVFQTLINKLKKDYSSVDEKRLVKDTRFFVESLIKEGFLEREEDSLL